MQKSLAKATAAHSQTCVARQPILDRRGHVFGYELLFRRSATVQSCDVASADACVQVIVDAMHSIGLDTLASGKRAFMNVTREFLLSDAATLLPKDQVVIELLEDIEVDHEVVAACKALKRAGYTLALDDFTYSESIAELLPLADYVKIDFLAIEHARRPRSGPRRDQAFEADSCWLRKSRPRSSSKRRSRKGSRTSRATTSGVR